jgi:hypothetical protein
MANLPNTNAIIPVNEQDSNKVGNYNLALQILDAAINGQLDIANAGGTVTLTGTTGSLATAQAQNLFLNITSTLTSNLIIQIPIAAGTGRNRVYVVRNGSSGAFTVTVRKVGGTGVTVTQGNTVILLYNGTDIQYATPQIVSATGLLNLATIDTSALASWVPTWTNLTLGNGTVVAKYKQIGKWVVGYVSLVLGSTSSVSGQITFSLPVTSISYPGVQAGIQPIGSAVAFDGSTAPFEGNVKWLTTTTAGVQFWDSSGTYVVRAVPSSTVPFTWGTGDELQCEFRYEAA